MDTAQKIVGLAQSKLGCRYEYGGTGPEVFDCEGLLDWIMRELGVDDYQQGSAYQFEKYAHVTDLQQGDAVYSRGDEPEPPYPSHVGVFVGMESPGVGRMISALGEAYGVCYSSFSTTVDQASEDPGAYWGATRPADLVAAKPEPEPEPVPVSPNPTPAPPAPQPPEVPVKADLVQATGDDAVYLLSGTIPPEKYHVSPAEELALLAFGYSKSSNCDPAHVAAITTWPTKAETSPVATEPESVVTEPKSVMTEPESVVTNPLPSGNSGTTSDVPSAESQAPTTPA